MRPSVLLVTDVSSESVKVVKGVTMGPVGLDENLRQRAGAE